MRKIKSLNSAMWGYFCVFAAIITVIAVIIFYFVAINTLQSRAAKQVQAIGHNVKNELAGNNAFALEAMFSRYREEGIIVYVLSPDGTILIPKETEGGDFVKINEIIAQLNASEKGSAAIYRSDDAVNYAAEAKFLDKPCYILVTYSLGLVRASAGNMLVYLIISGLAVILLALVISYIFSQRLTRGLKTMSEAAVNLAAGDYSVDFTNADYKEMAQLSDTLNHVRDEVKKSEDFQREILANVTHDLKTPLTMIKAYASMIKEISGDNPEKRDKHLQVIIDETDRLTGLVNDVLSVSKVNSNLNEVECKVFNLTEVVYGIINKFGYLQETQGYCFMVDIEPDLYTRADMEKIKQVIYNLVGNAANYTGEDKTVYICLQSDLENSRIKFSVRDTGKGISEEDLPNIWERYYRVSENHVRPVKGTGLGLNIVKVILKNHSFDFGVESKVGKGSVFWVDFPMVETGSAEGE